MKPSEMREGLEIISGYSEKEQDLIYGFFKKLSKRTNRNFDGGKFETYAQKLKIKADYDNHK
jgi:hypothetical protein